MNLFILFTADLIAITLFVAMYFVRHRRDLVVALLTVNVGCSR